MPNLMGAVRRSVQWVLLLLRPELLGWEALQQQTKVEHM
jgi:hypothetical protein